MTKIYRATTILSLPVQRNGKLVYVIFSDEHYSLTVTDEEIQKAIEKTSYFKTGEIKLFKTVGSPGGVKKDDPVKKKPEKKLQEFPDVTSVQDAVEILKGDPYNVSPGLLVSPESVKEQAKAAGVKFPLLNP